MHDFQSIYCMVVSKEIQRLAIIEDLKIMLDCENVAIKNGDKYRTYYLHSRYEGKKWVLDVPISMQLINDKEYDVIYHLLNIKKTALASLIQLQA